MRKIIVSEMLSVDGYFARTNGDIDWHVVDEDFNEYAVSLLATIDTLILGRVTYDMFESYWPVALKDPATGPNDVKIAQAIDDAKKVVFSKSRAKSDWKNSEFFADIVPAEITKMKQGPGKDMVVYGSGSVVQALAKADLIDEYRLFIAAIVLGKGKPLFIDELKLKLLETKQFNNGNVLLRYQPKAFGITSSAPVSQA